MKLFRCDICKSPVGEFELFSLRDEFKSDEMAHACRDCMVEINNAYERICEALKPVKKTWMQKIIAKLIRKST